MFAMEVVYSLLGRFLVSSSAGEQLDELVLGDGVLLEDDFIALHNVTRRLDRCFGSAIRLWTKGCLDDGARGGLDFELL